MGLPTDQSLANMLARSDTDGMRSFVRSIRQGESLGVSIGQIMRNLAEEMRKRRRAHRRGAGAEGADQDPLPPRRADLPGDLRDPAGAGPALVHGDARRWVVNRGLVGARSRFRARNPRAGRRARRRRHRPRRRPGRGWSPGSGSSRPASSRLSAGRSCGARRRSGPPASRVAFAACAAAILGAVALRGPGGRRARRAC